MTQTNHLTQHIQHLESPSRCTSLVHTVAYLLFDAMRFDPANPSWSRGDSLLYSECFADSVQDAFAQAGCLSSEMPAGGFLALEDYQQQPKHVYCLMERSDSAKIPHGMTNITVFCPELPVDRQSWDVRSYDQLTVDDLVGLSSDCPLWVVAPITGTKLFETASSDTSNLPPLADRMSHLGTETAFSVLAQVHALRDQGRDIVSFGLGEPDFDTPGHVKEAAKRALDQNETHYGPSAGRLDIREAIARYIQRTRHVPVDVDEVVVTPGAKPIVFDAMMALLNPGDEVLYPNPGYPIYESVIEWLGAKAVPLPLLESNNWNFTVDDLIHRITPRTKMIVLNSPGNPVGTLIGESELREIARLAIERNLYVISDEVYSQIIFEGEFHSIISLPGMKERTILVDGFSKTYAMTGWRLGYGIMNKTLAEQVAKIETNIDSCTCSFSQIAGAQALSGPQDESLYMIQQFTERSKVIVKLLNDIEGVRCIPAGGAFYVFPNVSGACRHLGYNDAGQLQKALLHEAGVAVLPRTCFGRKNVGEDQEYIRLSFATSMELIREGLSRMKEFIER